MTSISVGVSCTSVDKIVKTVFFHTKIIYFSAGIFLAPKAECLFDIGHDGTWKGLLKRFTFTKPCLWVFQTKVK